MAGKQIQYKMQEGSPNRDVDKASRVFEKEMGSIATHVTFNTDFFLEEIMPRLDWFCQGSTFSGLKMNLLADLSKYDFILSN